MKVKVHIGKNEYSYLTDLLKTYADIVETSEDYPLKRATFKGAGHAIANIIDILDFSLLDNLTLEDCILLGDIYASNYKHAAIGSSARIYWLGAYDEILRLIEKYFDIKLRRDI